MGLFQALVLGIVQGFTELLPISSSAHLSIIPWVFNWSIPENFDIALHFGTLLAVGIFFFRDWIELFKGGYKLAVKKEKSTEGKMFWYLVAASIPGGLIGLLIDLLIGDGLEHIYILTAIVLIVMGIILYIVDEKASNKTKYEDMTFKQTFIIGLSQALAFIPGVSRSGITMTVGRALGIERESAAKFSFLLGTPIIFGATIYKLKDFVFDIPFVVGVITSFLVGFVVIKFLLDYLKKGSFKIFAIYRVVLGLAVLFIAFFLK